MLSQRLEELSRDPSDPNGIAELVVTALGTAGSYYICWKTRSGQYKQGMSSAVTIMSFANGTPPDSHGLPIELREWLCPTDGPTRDFDSLQVILGPGDGDFVASDCFRSYDSNTRSRPLSMMVSPADLPGDVRQRRSATVGSLEYPGTNRRTSLIYEEPSSTPERSREDVPRLASFVSIAARVNRFRRRPLSMYHTGTQPLVNPDGLQEEQPKEPGHSDVNSKSREGLNRLPLYRSAESEPQGDAAQKPVSSYVNAGVQTDSPPSPPPMQTTFHEYQHHRHTRDSSSASSTSSVFTSYSETSTRRSSIVEDHNTKSTFRQSYNYHPNPVLMGRMQDYFRASGYRLGDALQF
ncbi:hypothetical protein BKA67DRAFT_571839 [Truncatella angustata]|uniref:Uncharacterized protein n=1 Tax=Truncatella angustata TaxID=152316 RepID=A0A9P8UGB1_9PEZI|nr:uncharacterized protein BKA67DRAFT_571839 [Truncatella angustata]KAH6651757.1 hypothetical protein BKA67DRAFT_571839 [Truncatella angustata]